MSVSASFFFAADAELAALASQSPKAVSSLSVIRMTTPESSANSITVWLCCIMPRIWAETDSGEESLREDSRSSWCRTAQPGACQEVEREVLILALVSFWWGAWSRKLKLMDARSPGAGCGGQYGGLASFYCLCSVWAEMVKLATKKKKNHLFTPG